MKFDWIKTRQTRYGAYAGVYIIVIIAVLGAVNFLANRYDKSYDSTANKQFSLSDQTIKVVKGLKQNVRITYFDEQTRFPQARDLLDRYSALSPRLHVDYIDPVKKPQQAKSAGFKRDLQVLVDSGSKKEEAKSVSEEEITGALIRSLKSGERNACFVTGSGEHGIDETTRGGYASVKDALTRNNYTAKSVNLLQTGARPTGEKGAADAPPAAGKIEVPKDCTVLIVGGPQHDYVQPEADAIRAYVEGGGKALVLLNPPVDMGGGPPEDTPTLNALLGSWGVTVDKDLALDTSGIGQVFGLGPEVPLVASYESHAIVNQMKEVATAFPASRSLDVKNGDKTSVSKLFSTGENSFATTHLNGPLRRDPKTDKAGPLVLAAAGTLNNGGGRFVVVGCSLWVANGFLRFNGNRDLFLNMINWLTSDEDLISIRPKSPEDRPLNITPQKVNTLFWLSIVIFPLSVVAFGMVTWWKRR